jgi:hypothetical protein
MNYGGGGYPGGPPPYGVPYGMPGYGWDVSTWFGWRGRGEERHAKFFFFPRRPIFGS